MFALKIVADRKIESADIAAPKEPRDDEVQVQIRAVALNHIDVWGWRGMAFANRKSGLIPGAEAAGEIVSVGNRVPELRKGQIVALYGAQTCGSCQPCFEGRDNFCENEKEIYGFHIDGFFREVLNIPARLVVPAPEGIDTIAAALSPITFGTSEHMLFDNAKLKSGETVLVHAGGSGIGSAAIQLAKAAGAIVITTVGNDNKVQKAFDLGADYVINYKSQRFESAARRLTKKKGVDVVFEHVGPSTWKGSLFCLKKGGRLVTCGSTTGVTAETNLNILYQQQLRLIGSFGCTKKNVHQVMVKMAQGIVNPVIDTTISVSQVEQSLKRLEDRLVFGKIVVVL